MKKRFNVVFCLCSLFLVSLASGCSNPEETTIFNEEGKTYMHALKAGKSTITTTIEAPTGEKLVKEFNVEVKNPSPAKTLIGKASIKDNYNCITIKEALDKCAALPDGEVSEAVYCYGILDSAFDKGGNMYIKDDTGRILIYGCDKKEVPTDVPNKGDEVVVYGTLKNYGGKLEFYRPKFVEVKHQEVVLPDESLYVASTVKEARAKKAESLVKVEGVVATITKTQKFANNGFYLIDNTGSIFVHGSTAANSVSVGNKVTILGKRTNYISEKEATYAEKFGYQGSIQVSDVRVVENDNGNNPVDYSWCQKKTIDEIINTPMTENITTDVFETDAVIKKSVGQGFTNYYIDNIGEYAGSYVYTSNNGNDFSYLDEFDNKICHVYVSPINCKSTSSGTIYRFQPLFVEEHKDFKLENTCEFVYKAAASHFFEEVYFDDPVLELSSTYNYDRLSISDYKITYSSSNNDVITFNTTKESMMAEPEIETKSIKEAISSEDNTNVVVKGVVSGGLVNQSGFYLTDESGAIPVLCDSDTLSELQIGNKVYLSGVKTHVKPEGCLGQLAITEAKVLFNAHGTNEMIKTSFVKDQTLETLLKDNSSDVERSDHMYTVSAIITKVKGSYSTNYYINSVDKTESIQLYAASAAQYNFLDSFVTNEGEEDKVVTVDFSFVNWNKKTYYRGYVLSVTDGAKTEINRNNFQNN